VGGGASAQEQGTDVAPDANAVEASAQEQLELEVPAIESPVEPAEQPLGAEVGPAADVPAEPEGAADDIEAAIAAANEQIGVASTLDDIVPGTTQGEEGAEESENLAPRFGAPWWPFLVYLVLWLAFAGLGIWQLNQLPAGQVAYETQPYMLFLFGGIIMAAVGPILILAVWLATWLRARRMRTGLFTSALVKGAIVTVIGVAIWWGSFMALDYLRLGRTF
jgi:hypothetical protein